MYLRDREHHCHPVKNNRKGVKENNERPPFIPEYCWDRDQSFALFVPEVEGNVGQSGDNDSGGGCFIETVAFGSDVAK